MTRSRHVAIAPGASRYLEMERQSYADLVARSDFSTDAFTRADTAEFVVGSYAQHEAFDYEHWLLDGVDIAADAVALEYGCGPGRMILRMAPRFSRVDGVDISPEIIEVARRRCAHLPAAPRLLANDGQDLPVDFHGAYDVALSVICLQHICVHSVRNRILRSLFDALKPGGLLTFQMGYGPGHAAAVDYFDDFVEATSTNGLADVRVLHPGEIAGDLARIGFTAITYALTPTGPGDTHGAWIFVRAHKPDPARDLQAAVAPGWTRCDTGLVPGDPPVTRARRLHLEHGLVASARLSAEHAVALEQRVQALDADLERARGAVQRLEDERAQLIRRVEIDERQLSRLQTADQDRVRAVMADLVKSATAGGMRVALFGAGAHTDWLLRATALGTLPGLTVFDSDARQWGRLVAGAAVRPVAELAGTAPDIVVVSSLAFQEEMTATLEALGLPGLRIVRCYP